MRISDWSSDVCSSDLIDMAAAVPHLALRQQVPLENRVDRLEIELRRHIAHGAILLVKRLGCVGAFAIALDKVSEHRPMALEMAAKVHRHEPRKPEKRSEERRVGKECVSTGRSRWWTSH